MGPDVGIAAFATIVLTATAIAAVPRSWHPLLVTITVVVGLQLEWLAAESVSPPSPGDTLRRSALRSHFARDRYRETARCRASRARPSRRADLHARLVRGNDDADAPALRRARRSRSHPARSGRGLGRSAFAALYARRLPDLGLAVGVAALALAAVGTADLLSDAALTLAWAAQALVFLALTRRLGDARLHAFGLIYFGLAAVSVLVSAGNPAYLFDRAADQLAGALPLAAVAVAAIGGALLPPRGLSPPHGVGPAGVRR